MESKDLSMLSPEELLALVTELQRQIGELRASNEALRAEIDQLKRGGKRQAAPFSKGTRVAEPKPPGRKPGHCRLNGYIWKTGLASGTLSSFRGHLMILSGMSGLHMSTTPPQSGRSFLAHRLS